MYSTGKQLKQLFLCKITNVEYLSKYKPKDQQKMQLAFHNNKHIYKIMAGITDRYIT